MTTVTETEVKIIDSCTDIKMDDFISILVENKLQLLAVSGIPSPIELQKAWDKIYAEYTDLIGDENHNDVLKLLQDINILNWQYQRIENIIQVLMVCHVPFAIDELKRLGYIVRFDPNDLNQYFSDLQSAYNRAKTLLIEVQTRQNDLEKIQQQKRAKAASRGDFQSMFIGLSEYMKYQVRPEEITAYQFAVMIRRSREYAEKLQKQVNKQKGGKSWPKN